KINNAQIIEVATRERVFRNIMGCLAGKCAAERLHGFKADDGNWWRTSGDYKQAYESALELNDGDSLGAKLLLKWLERKTELLLEQQWPRVTKLAFALLENDGQLNCDQIKKALAA